jgi:pimeloyl-ACP methyl ester carboxylesterase
MVVTHDRPPARGQMIQVNGVKLYYEVHGHGTPLLLLHAGSLTCESWQPYLAAFEQHYRVFTPDSRGHGRSDSPPDTLSYRLLADDVAGLVHALDLHKPLIVGFSDGGQVALEIGMRYPNLPRALVVGGAQFKFSAAYLAWVLDAIGDQAAPEVDTARFSRNHPAWAAWLQQIYGPDGWKPVLARCKPMWITPLNYTADDFAEVVAHTLVLIGDRDEITSIEEATELFRRLPNGELAVVPGADHGAFFSAGVAAFQSLILNFLQRHADLDGEKATQMRRGGRDVS